MSEPTVVTDEAAFESVAAEAPADARVPIEVRLTVADPFDAYRRARAGGDGSRDSVGNEGVFLETTGGQPGWGYFAVDPTERIQVGEEAVSLHDASPSLETIDALLERETLVRGDCSVPYPCGAFGWLGYDVVREVESLPDTTTFEGLPRLQLRMFDRVAAWTEPRGAETTLRITACPVIGDDPSNAYEQGLDRAMELARAASESTTRSPPDHSIGESTDQITGESADRSTDRSIDQQSGESAARSTDDSDQRTDEATTSSDERVTFSSSTGREAYGDRVGTVKEYIRAGDTFQANISHRLTAPATVHPVTVYDALRRVNPAPYSGLLEFRGVDLVSASPELLLDVDGRELITEPIAGTRPRGETDADDRALEADLLSDEKERAEHAMLVDLERNDLGKVSEYGSVAVEEYRRIDRYSEVMHLVSVVTGRRREDVSIADAIGAVFPGGTITGAPKPRTMAIIDEVESTRRGPYTGSIGVIGFDDRATLNMTIRTLERWHDEYRLRVGGGVVHDSDPDAEYDETLDKARALVTAVDEALGEDVSFGMDEGKDR